MTPHDNHPDGSIFLRAMEPEDLELLYTIENDSSLWDVGTNRSFFSRYALRRYLSEQPADIFQSGDLRLTICRRTDARPVGLVDLTGFNPIDSRAEVGIALLREARGRRYGTEAIARLEEFATGQLRIHQLYAYISKENNPVCRQLFLSAGYQEVAVLPDWHFLRDDYEDVSLFQKIFEKKRRKICR